MKKGISNFFGYEYDYNQIYKDIKNAGFDCIMSSSDKNFFYQTGNPTSCSNYHHQLTTRQRRYWR